MLSISINQIEYVLALVRTGSFSKAADQCYITQSTLSTMIKKLENQLGFPLFDRKSKPIQLTQQGAAIINQFKVVQNEYDNLEELIEATKNEFHGILKLGIIPTIAPFLLPLILDNLVVNYPQLNFKIHETTTSEILNKLKTRELDIGILSLPINNKDFTETSLFTEDFLVYDAKTDKQQSKKKYKINDIDISRLWLLEESHCMSSQIGKICSLKKQHKINGKLEFNSGSILSLVELVNINKGITVLPRLATLKSNIVNPDWIYPLQSPVPVRDVGLITLNSFAKKRLFKLLKSEIIKTIKPILKKSGKIKIIEPF